MTVSVLFTQYLKQYLAWTGHSIHVHWMKLWVQRYPWSLWMWVCSGITFQSPPRKVWVGGWLRGVSNPFWEYFTGFWGKAKLTLTSRKINGAGRNYPVLWFGPEGKEIALSLVLGKLCQIGIDINVCKVAWKVSSTIAMIIKRIERCSLINKAEIFDF